MKRLSASSGATTTTSRIETSFSLAFSPWATPVNTRWNIQSM